MIANFINQRRSQLHKLQRGGILIESIIGMLILGIVGGGIMHTTARMTVAQRDMTVQNIAVSQMRNILMTGGVGGVKVCDDAPSLQVPGNQNPVAVTVKGCAAVEMKINGIKIDGTTLAEQKVNAVRPRVLEVGTGNALVRLGGKVNEPL